MLIGKDAYIISFIFNYQLKSEDMNISSTEFPEIVLEKVMKMLDDNNINYVIVDGDSNYEVINERDFKKDNKYLDVCSKAYKYQDRKCKIDAIHEYLLNNIDEDELRRKIRGL